MLASRSQMELKNINKKEVREVLELIDSYKSNTNIDAIAKNRLYNRCKSIIDHDEWYTEEQMNSIYDNASTLTIFSKKQKRSLMYSNIVKREEYYDYDDGANSDEARRWRD